MIDNFRELLDFQIRRHSARYSKGTLTFLEDLQRDHECSIERAKLVIPKEYHDILDQLLVLTDSKMGHIRKRILDNGGDFVRDIQSELENYDVSHKIRNKDNDRGKDSGR